MPTSVVTSRLATSCFRLVSGHNVGERWLLRRGKNRLPIMVCSSDQTEMSWMTPRTCWTFSTSTSTAGSSSQKQKKQQSQRQSSADPMAKRPTIKCDPYGQGGKPLSQIEATRLLATVDDKWVLEYDHNVDIIEGNETQAIKPTVDTPPYALTREFLHPDYLSATRFLIKMAAVAQVQDHFPCSLSVERRIIRKQWQVLSKIVCRTTVLKGLSQHDFHLAMMMDVEIARPDVQALLLQKEK